MGAGLERRQQQQMGAGAHERGSYSTVGVGHSQWVTDPDPEHTYSLLAVMAILRTPSLGPLMVHIRVRDCRSQQGMVPSEQPANRMRPTIMTHHTCLLTDTRSSASRAPCMLQHRTHPSEDPVYTTSPSTWEGVRGGGGGRERSKSRKGRQWVEGGGWGLGAAPREAGEGMGRLRHTELAITSSCSLVRHRPPHASSFDGQCLAPLHTTNNKT